MRFACMAVLLLWTWVLGGCATGPNGLEQPRIRIGGLPYPGLTNYVVLDTPQALGAHRYQRIRAVDDDLGEVSAGIAYTRFGGFIDLAHIRSTVDWVRFIYLATLDRMLSVTPEPPEPLRWSWLGMDYQMQILMPHQWASLQPEQRRKLAQELASVQAQRLATVVSTWHEIGSWYGQMIVPPFQEIRSAFTWDDSSSHVFAAIVGGRALAHGDPHDVDNWNRAVTRELAQAFAELQPVDSACQNTALARTHGVWWRGGQTLKRDLDTGLQGPHAKQAWLVQDLACAEGAGTGAESRPSLSLRLPDLQALDRTHPAELWPQFVWHVTMPGWLTEKVLGCSEPCAEQVFKGEESVLKAVERMRTQIELTSGPQALMPYPATGPFPGGEKQVVSSQR